MLYFTKENGPRGPILLIYNEFARPAGQENRGQCGQNLRKTMIFVNFFGVSLEKALWRFWALKGPNLGSKKGVGSDEKRKLKKRLVRRRVGNLYFPKKEGIPTRGARGQTSWKGGRGDG